MDPPTYSHAEKMGDGEMETSHQTKDLGRDSNEKAGSETALPSELIISAGSQHLHRKLGGKEVQLLAVGGAIGTCMDFFRTLKRASHSSLFYTNCLNQTAGYF